MKSFYFLILIIGFGIISCDDRCTENITESQWQMQEKLLEYVTFESNRYVFDLGLEEAIGLNIDRDIYKRFADKVKIANDTLTCAEIRGVKIVDVNAMFSREVKNECLSRYMETDKVTTGKIDPVNRYWGESSSMFCNALDVRVRCDSAIWGVEVETTFGKTIIAGTKSGGKGGIFEQEVNSLPIVIGTSFTYL